MRSCARIGNGCLHARRARAVRAGVSCPRTSLLVCRYGPTLLLASWFFYIYMQRGFRALLRSESDKVIFEKTEFHVFIRCFYNNIQPTLTNWIANYYSNWRINLKYLIRKTIKNYISIFFFFHDKNDRHIELCTNHPQLPNQIANNRPTSS